jgi:hypothetical protein
LALWQYKSSYIFLPEYSRLDYWCDISWIRAARTESGIARDLAAEFVEPNSVPTGIIPLKNTPFPKE